MTHRPSALGVRFAGPNLLASFVVALVASLGSHDALAQSFRCRNDLVSVGESKAAILLKCGEPVVRDSFCRTPNTRNANGTGTRPRADLPCENVDEWTYKPGYGQRITTLRFEEGKLQSITYGDRQ